MKMGWQADLTAQLDEEGYSVDDVLDYRGLSLYIEVAAPRTAIEVSYWNKEYIFSEIIWDETHGRESERDLMTTTNPEELLDIALSLVSCYK